MRDVENILQGELLPGEINGLFYSFLKWNNINPISTNILTPHHG